MRVLSAAADAAAERPALTAEQESAASRRAGSMLLAAAAGSGKTSVLVERYVRAVIDDGIDPARILAITFTERAAWELRERIRARLQMLDAREQARDTEAASIGTIHGFCARLLRADPLGAGVAPSFTILEEASAVRIRAAAFTDALAAVMACLDTARLDVAAAYGPDRLRQIVSAAYAELRSRGQLRPTLPPPPAQGPPDALAAYALIGDLLTGYGDAYEQRKGAYAALDFDDLELHALTLLQQPTLRGRWLERFDMLMVDEFQDTNRRQLALLSAIEGENLFTVGDEWQSIYGFRHAEVEVFRRRESELAGRGASLALTRNFRSRPAIIDAVNAAFARRFGERFTELTPAREPAPGAEPAVEVLLTETRGWAQDQATAASDFDGLRSAPAWRQAEARLIAGRIRRLVDEGRAHPGEVALLLRSMTDLSLYESALRASGLASTSASAALWETIEVQDAICGLRALANPLDELALHGALAGPRIGLSAGGLWQLARSARQEGGGLWQAICQALETPGGLDPLSREDRQRLSGFHERFAEDRRTASERTLAALVRLVAGREPGVAQHEQASIDALQRLAADFESLEGRDLRGFLEHLAHLAQTRAAVGGLAPPSDGQAVRLMSIHAAKGLEFPVVVVADLGRSGNGREAPYLLLDDQRAGLRVARLDGGAPQPAFDYESLLAERALAEEQEEDRILYVAMTRAREMLLLSGAASFERWPEDAPGCPPIAWMAPALIEDLPARLAGAAQAGTEQGQPALALSRPASEPDLPVDARPPVAPQAPDRKTLPTENGQAQTSVAAQHVASARAHTRHTVRPNQPQVGATLSYTALSELERCGYRYYLERVLRLSQRLPTTRSAPARRSMPDRARTVGEITHRMMERLDFSRPGEPGREEVLAAAAQMGVPIDASACREIARMLAGLRETPLGRRLTRARSVRTEQPFCFALSDGETSIAGVFDAIATEHDGARLVIDYKTGTVAQDQDIEALVADDYELQRLTYALAALRDGAAVVEVVHWYLHRPQEPVAVRFAASQLDDLDARLGNRVRAARERGFAVSDAPHRRLCGSCPGRGGLCSWPQSATLGERPSDLGGGGR
jgi:ATP-dependent helicase/nuclease subunit A